jgi:hypothetical protein
MKPFTALFASAAAHQLLLNWFHQDDSGEWVANWRLSGLAEHGFRASALTRGDDPYETLSRSLQIAIVELGSDTDLFGEMS